MYMHMYMYKKALNRLKIYAKLGLKRQLEFPPDSLMPNDCMKVLYSALKAKLKGQKGKPSSD